jgi:hypothetical protein
MTVPVAAPARETAEHRARLRLLGVMSDRGQLHSLDRTDNLDDVETVEEALKSHGLALIYSRRWAQRVSLAS